MPSANKTDYGLNQWQGNEYPKREDFNSDNLIIDTQIKNVNDKADGKINKSLATAASQFLISSAAGQWVIKTITEIKTILGLGSAAEKDFNTVGGVASYDTVNAHLSDYVRQPGYGVATGSANTYAVTLSPTPAAYVDGMGIVVKIPVTNTGASTINVNGLGAKAIVDGKGSALAAGKLKINAIYSLKYNSAWGTFQLQGEGGEIPKLPNYVKNGSFENGSNCYTIFNNVTLSTSHPYDGVNSVLFNNNNGSCSLVSNVIPAQTNDKVYMTATVYLNSYTSGNFSTYILGVSATDTQITAGGPVNIDTSRIGQHQRISAVYNIPSSFSNLGFRVVIASYQSVANSNVDCLYAVNLTQIFGAGNEPTKEEVDAMVQKYGGWWDSDLTLLTSDANAVSGDILLNKTAYANGSKLTGSMPNHLFNESATEISGNYTAQRLYMKPAQGYWDGLKSIYADDPNFIAANIVSGKSIFGLAGSFAGKRWASGTIVSSSTSIAFEYRGGGTATWYSITVSGLTFKPSFIMVQLVSIPFTYVTTYDEMGLDYPKSIKMFTTNTTVFNANIIHFKGDAASASVTNTGFVLPVNASNATYSWIAFE